MANVRVHLQCGSVLNLKFVTLAKYVEFHEIFRNRANDVSSVIQLDGNFIRTTAIEAIMVLDDA